MCRAALSFSWSCAHSEFFECSLRALLRLLMKVLSSFSLRENQPGHFFSFLGIVLQAAVKTAVFKVVALILVLHSDGARSTFILKLASFPLLSSNLLQSGFGSTIGLFLLSEVLALGSVQSFSLMAAWSESTHF